MYNYDHTGTLRTTSREGKYHSYGDLPSIHNLSTNMLIWHENGIIHRPISLGPAILSPTSMVYIENNITILSVNFPKRKSVKIKERHSNGNLDGEYYIEYYDTDSNLLVYSIKGNYENGKRIGKWIVFHTMYSTSKNIIKHSLNVELYYKEGIMCHYNNIKVIYDKNNDSYDYKFVTYGDQKMYDDKGNILLEYSSIDGNTNGLMKEYQNGKLSTEVQFLNGRSNGYYKKYNNDEKLILYNTYKDGNLDGPHESYYDSGSLKTRGTYIDGNLDGNFLSQYDNNIIKAIGSYMKGKVHGKYTEYYKSGNIKYTVYYNNGKKDGEYIKFYDSQERRVIAKCIYKNDMQLGQIANIKY